ncbi:centrosome-associated protein CEP250-like [Athene cunicularia]|uniref:centrosome-associated protein CEP250-like n=1 Tax=Athene cunicularia TaxID=194338 RepID=UPI000EF6B702|nr:centrosome-associated protein CEP250-like [Athene cunicularia]
MRCYSFLMSGHRNCSLLSLQAEQSVAELRGAQNKLSAEVADLHIAAAKMSSINEALALDKVQLNKLVLQLEQENEVLSGRVEELERAKISDREKLNSCERTNEELSEEKAHLEQLLKKMEEQREGLQVELRMLAEEKAETQEQLSQVRPKTWCFPGGLLGAGLREALSAGFCGGFVKERPGSAGGQKLFFTAFWKCVDGWQSCSAILSVVLCFYR